MVTRSCSTGVLPKLLSDVQAWATASLGIVSLVSGRRHLTVHKMNPAGKTELAWQGEVLDETDSWVKIEARFDIHDRLDLVERTHASFAAIHIFTHFLPFSTTCPTGIYYRISCTRGNFKKWPRGVCRGVPPLQLEFAGAPRTL